MNLFLTSLSLDSNLYILIRKSFSRSHLYCADVMNKKFWMLTKVVWGTHLKSFRLGLQPINSRRWLENRDLSKHNLIILHKVLYLRRYLSNEAFLIYPNYPYVMIPRNNKSSFKVTQQKSFFFSFLFSSLLFRVANISYKIIIVKIIARTLPWLAYTSCKIVVKGTHKTHKQTAELCFRLSLCSSIVPIHPNLNSVTLHSHSLKAV